MANYRSVPLVLFAVLLLAAVSARSEDAAPVGPTAVLPGNADLVLHVPDVTALRKALGDSEFGKLWDEPEMRAFAQPAWDALLAKYAEARQQNPMLPDFGDLARAFQGEVAVALSVPILPGEPPLLCVAARVDDAQALAKLLAPALQGAPVPENMPFDLPGGAGLVFEKGLLLLASQQGEFGKMRARLRGGAAGEMAPLAQQPGWQSAQKLAGPGLVRLYVATPRLIAVARLLAGEKLPQLGAALDKSGVNAISGLIVQLGARGDCLALDCGALASPPPQSVLATLLDPAPVAAEALKVVPEKATFCTAWRWDLKATWDAVSALLDPNMRVQVAQALQGVNEAAGMDIEKDLLASLGDTWISYDTGGTELFGWFPSQALAVTLTDPPKAERAAAALLKLAEQAAKAKQPIAGPQVDFREVKIGETRVRYLNLSPVPISPALAFAGGRLILTTSVAGMRRALAQLAAPGDLTGDPAFRAALERVTGRPLDLKALPAYFSFARPSPGRDEAGMVSDLGQSLTGMLRIQARMREAFGGPPLNAGEKAALDMLEKLDFALFPLQETFARHQRPTASAWTTPPGGVMLRQDLGVPALATLTSGQGYAYILPAVGLVALPALLKGEAPANETVALASLRAYCEAQDIYRRTDWNQDGVLEYAQSLNGNKQPPQGRAVNTKFGLYLNGDGTNLSLVDKPTADAEGNPSDNPKPKNGYCFKVLMAQGPHAPGGQKSYISNPNEQDPLKRHLTLGYALVAFPAKYPSSGRFTYVINQTGRAYKKDLGPDTAKVVEALTEYDPDDSWSWGGEEGRRAPTKRQDRPAPLPDGLAPPPPPPRPEGGTVKPPPPPDMPRE